jgi:hypothetical protein
MTFRIRQRGKDDTPDMKAAALDYLAKGKSVIPICTPLPEGAGCRQHGVNCKGPGKTPLIPWREYQQRRATEAEVDLWFARWPSANLGMVTGAISGTVVVDADDAAAVNFAMSQGEGELASAPMVQTGKGAHWHIQAPDEEVRNFARKRPGLDFRGDGGYVLLPPSLHRSGVRYRWHATEEDMGGRPPVPPWLMELLHGTKPEPKAGEALAEEDGERLDYDRFVEGVGEGQRNDLIFRLASSLRARGIDYEVAHLTLLGAAARCVPPMDDDEAVGILDRVWATYDEPPPSVRMPDDWDDTEDEEVAGSEIGSEDDPYPFITLDEFLAIEDPEEDWLIDGLVAGASLNWFYADSGVGKTLVAAWYMLHIAAGRPLQGRQVVQGPVMFVSEDTGSRRVRKYIRKLKRGGDFPDELPIVINPHPRGLHLTDEKGFNLLRERIERYDPKLVVLDSCEKVVPSKDYKSVEYVQLSNLITYCRERGTALIVIDHCNKGKAADGGKPKPSMSRIFGSQAKQRDIDFAVEFNGSFDTEVTATYTKQRDEPPSNYSVRVVPKGFEAIALELDVEVKLGDLTDEERTIFLFLEQDKGERFTTSGVADGTGMPKRSVQRYLRTLVTKGVIQAHEKRGLGAREVRYCTPPEVDVLGKVQNA